jgi:hypothetical protein
LLGQKGGDTLITRSSTPKDGMTMSRSTYRSAVRVALVTTAVLLVPLVAMQFTEEVNWSPFDFVFAAALLGGTGLLLELAVRKPSRFAYRVATTAVGVGAIVLGQVDDAPGLVLFGLLLIAGTIALAIKTA